MSEQIELAPYDGQGVYNPVIVTPSVKDSVGAIALAIVVIFLLITLMRSHQRYHALVQQLLDTKSDVQVDESQVP